MSFITGLIGAIFGACIAYFSDWVKEQRKQRNEQHGAIVRTQLALIGQYNTIANLQQQYLDQFRNDTDRHLKMVHFDMQCTNLHVAYDSISFLLMTKNPEVVLDVHAAEETYFSAMESLSSRNQAFEKLHSRSQLNQLDPKTGRTTITVSDPRDLHLLKQTTDNLYKTVDAAGDRLATQIKQLEKTGKSLYPARKFLQIAGEK